jgi:hypothetical protein
MWKASIVVNKLIYVCFSLFNLQQHLLHLWLVGCQTPQQYHTLLLLEVLSDLVLLRILVLMFFNVAEESWML